MNNESPLLTILEVAALLRVNPATVHRWIDNGVLEAIPLPHKGKRVAHRIPLTALQALLNQGSQAQV